MPTKSKSKSRAKSKRSAGLSERNKQIIATSTGGIVVVLGAWWAFYHFTTVSPPDLKAPGAASKVEQVVDCLGNERCFGRLATPRQEEFLLTAYRVYGNDAEARARFISNMNQMSTSQREVLANGIFNISRDHVLQHAREYASLPPSQRSGFIDKAYGDFQNMRTQLSGQSAGGGGGDLSAPLKKSIPDSSDELMKSVVDKTDGKERAEAKPFIDAMLTKHKEMHSKGK